VISRHEPINSGFKFKLGYSFSSFFWLDPKEPKGQDLPKLQPHQAEHWLAGKSSHRALPIDVLFTQVNSNVVLHLFTYLVCKTPSFPFCMFTEYLRLNVTNSSFETAFFVN
jgi:hypothetical protein